MPSQLSEMTFSALFSVLKSPTQPPYPQLLACLPVSPGNRGSRREAHKLPGDTPPPLWSQVVSLATHHARPHLGLRVPCSPATRDTAPASLSWGASLPSPASLSWDGKYASTYQRQTIFPTPCPHWAPPVSLHPLQQSAQSSLHLLLHFLPASFSPKPTGCGHSPPPRVIPQRPQ